MSLLRDFSEFSEQRLCDFTGREWLLRGVQEFLGDPQAPRFLLIIGEPGIGKSAFSAYLWQRKQVLDAVHFCIGRRGGTTEPLRFIQSIAEQLSNRLPGFGQALIEAQEALSGRTVDLTVTQRIESMQGGQVTGVSIQDLGNRVLPPETAFDRRIRCPLRALEETGSLPQVVILVDALDEATTYTAHPNIVEILTKAHDLPRQVRFILTSRPESSIKNSFADRPHITIEAQSSENQVDITDYLTQVLRRDRQLQGLLIDAGWDEARFVKELGETSEWNFLYLSLVLPEIAAGQLPLGAIELPHGLDEYYRYLLRTRLGSGKWDAWGADLMEVVLSLRAPASLEQIGAYMEWPKRQTHHRLEQIRQLLDPVLLEKGRYWRYHLSVVDFLANRRCAEEFWCDEEQGHTRIADHYLRVWGGLDAALPGLQDLEKRDLHSGYGLRHLVAHLERAKRHDVLHRLLALETGEQRNTWFEVKHATGDASGYVADVMTAWTLAKGTYDPTGDTSAARSIGLDCRYALIAVSLNSLALNTPPVLISALVECGVWPWEQGLAYALQIPWSEARAQALADLIPCLPEAKRRDVAREGLTATREFGSSDTPFYRDRQTKSRIGLLADLVAYLPGPERERILHEGLTVAKSISDVELCSEAIADLAPCMTQSLLHEALDIMCGLWFDPDKAAGLARLAPYLEEPLLSRAVSVARAIESRESQAVALLGLAPYVPEEESFEEALAAIQRSPRRAWDSVPWAEELIEFASQSPEPLRKKLLGKALTEIRGIRYSYWRAWMLMRLAPHLPESLRGQILQEALAAARASPEKARYGYGYFNYQAKALTQLAILLAKLDYQAEALALAREIEKKWEWHDGYVEAMSGIARRLPVPLAEEVLREVLTKRRTVQDRRIRAEVLRELALYTPKAFGLRELWARGRASLLNLAAVPERKRKQWSARAQEWLLSRLPESPLRWRLAIVRKDELSWNWACAVEKVAPYMSELLLREALAAAWEIEETDYREQLLRKEREIEDPNHRAGAMAAAQARISTGEISEPMSRARALAGLTCRLAELGYTQEAIEHVQEIESMYWRARALMGIAPYLADPVKSNVVREALEVALAVVPKYEGRRLLADLAPNGVELGCPEVVLVVVQEIKDAELRAETLTAMTPQLTKLAQNRLYCLWQEALPVLASRTRGSLLSDLQALAPIIVALGGKEAVAEVSCAIQDVGRWWP